MTVDLARLAADAVLYEGYLLYPYRGDARKNQVRWQFGVLGPPGAAAAGVGEEPDLAVQCLVRRGSGPRPASVRVHLRFLQLQRRTVERAGGDGTFTPVAALEQGGRRWTSWDEAVEVERELGPYPLDDLGPGVDVDVRVEAAREVEALPGGRLVRRRRSLRARVTLTCGGPDPAQAGLVRLGVRVVNTGAATTDKDEAIRSSLIGTHLLLAAEHARFVSVLRPADDAAEAAAACRQHRCWPVLAGDGGPDGETSDVVLASPIILYDHPAVAPESAGAMFDSTEIDEILTLRVMTLTDEEKAAARATDAAAAAIIDRCERMTPAELGRLHGVMRDPHAAPGASTGGDRGAGVAPEVPWWDPAADAAVDPGSDAVLIGGASVRRGSVVVVRPSRRADAQDLFFAGRLARVTSVHLDVDGETHVGVVLLDDPAADLHDWYGRSLYFAPDELEPVAEDALTEHGGGHPVSPQARDRAGEEFRW